LSEFVVRIDKETNGMVKTDKKALGCVAVGGCPGGVAVDGGVGVPGSGGLGDGGGSRR
jgi:hypothetical protein